MKVNLSFFNGKKVLLTGHTGFKGAWISRILIENGANLTGYALEAAQGQNLYSISGIASEMNSVIGDIRDFSSLEKLFRRIRPEIVIHMAAQPLVRISYDKPRYTYETNVMGTVNVCECMRKLDCVRSFLNITTDKVYKNQEWEWGYRESDPLDGYDPYSNSKSCSELVTHSYRNSFFNEIGMAVSTARAGNVIGGGDFAKDRIIPDCIRAALEKRNIEIRNPNAVRPFQHVLEPVMAYLMILEKQYYDLSYQGYYNVGPEDQDCITVGELVSLFAKYWGKELSWINCFREGPHEAKYLKLDCSKLKQKFDWHPTWDINTAVKMTVEWSKAYQEKQDMKEVMCCQVEKFYKEMR